MDNVEIFTQYDWENNPYQMVRIDRGNGEYTTMSKADYDASTLPSNSSIQQAGE